jgi:uncharacterized RDD family membrane protein YckC
MPTHILYRPLALLIDGAICNLFLFLLFWGIILLPEGIRAPMSGFFAWAFVLLLFINRPIYEMICFRKGGASLGKRLFGLKVVKLGEDESDDYDPQIGTGRFLLREGLKGLLYAYFGWFILAIEAIVYFVSEDHRSVIDRVMQTEVRQVRPRSSKVGKYFFILGSLFVILPILFMLSVIIIYGR